MGEIINLSLDQLDKVPKIIINYTNQGWSLIYFDVGQYGESPADKKVFMGFEKADKTKWLQVNYYGDILIIPGV